MERIRYLIFEGEFFVESLEKYNLENGELKKMGLKNIF